MTVWYLLEWEAWLLSALVAGWLVYDAVLTSRRYSEEFLTHTLEDLGTGDLTNLDDPGAEGPRP
jgi:hypothetical protein